jgi:cysteine desulfurase family protein
MDKRTVYLDNASTSFPKPKEVLKEMVRCYERCGVNAGRSQFSLATEAEKIISGTREKLTRFFGGEIPSRLVFSYNVTDSLNIAILGILGPGDHVIITELEHNAVLRPIYHLLSKGDIEVDYITFDAEGYLDPDDFLKRFKRNTRMAIVCHGSNVIGAVQDVAAIGAHCRERGVIFVIDAAQTAGVIPIDVRRMNIDIVAFTGHKSLLGPTGIGGMYIAGGVSVAATRFGGSGILSDCPRQPDQFPLRLEAGTVNILGVAGLSAGIDFIEREGMENIHCREMELLKKLREGLSRIEGITFYGPAGYKNRVAVLSFNLSGIEATRLGSLLAERYDIATRAGLHCAPRLHRVLGTAPEGTVRVSPGPLNSPDDIDYFLGAVDEIAREVRG